MNEHESINWQAIREELIWDDEAHHLRRESERLRQRAAQYAAADQHTGDDRRTQTELIFDLGAERYGVDVMLVRGLRTLPRLTPVPGSPRFYKGVVNLRGQIVTVMDLRPFIDVTEAGDERNPPTELVVVQAGRLEIALLAHHVYGVAQIAQADITLTSDIRYTRGVTPDRLVLLDIAAMFNDERLITGGTEG